MHKHFYFFFIIFNSNFYKVFQLWFSPKNIRKAGFNSGSWVEVFEENHQIPEDSRKFSPEKSQKLIKKNVLNLNEIRAAHGEIELENLLKLKLNGKNFSEISSENLEFLNPIVVRVLKSLRNL